MIIETLLYAASLPLAGRAFRAHVPSAVSLWSRARRCRMAWAPHEAKTKQAVLGVVETLKSRRTAVVLGSGLCRDVPLEALAKAFDTVVLVDLVHLLPVRLAARRLGNVRLIERDLLEDDGLGFLRQVPYLDLVVSANLLSQLPIGLARRVGSDHAAVAAPGIIARHLDDLAALPAASVLVTDIAFSAIARDGRSNPPQDLLFGIPQPPPFAAWDWTVVPFGEEDPHYRIDHHVIAAQL